LIRTNPLASLYLTHFDLVDKNGKLIRKCKPMPTTYTSAALLKAILVNEVDIMGTGYVMRSADYDRIGGIPIRYPSLLYADFELWINIADISFEAIAPKNCFAFRMHQSTAHSTNDAKMHEAMNIFIDFLASIGKKKKEFNEMINNYGTNFIQFYCRGFSHRLLRIPMSKRKGLTVVNIVEQTKKWARVLDLDKKYFPENKASIKIASIIDSNGLLRQLFLLFKKAYSKSLIK
jgi:hypothetical protein